MRLVLSLLILFISIILSSCASRVRPTGGEKDILPPNALSYSPDMYSTNFKSNQVIIQFDEFIQLNDPFKQIVISPIIKPNPTFTIKKKALIITLPDSLLENTTYNINFGASIEDLHESNAAQSFQYVFSTGAVIDSLKINGKITLAKDNSPQKNVVVMLHKQLNDTAFTTTTPSYIGRSDENGNFQLLNISPGTYSIYALVEENNNYMFDRPDELIAFEMKQVSVPDSGFHVLRLFNNKPRKVEIKECRSAGLGKQLIIFNQSVDPKMTVIKRIEQATDIRMDYSMRNDSVTLWWKDFSEETFSISVNYDGEVLDTFKISNSVTIKQRGNSQARSTPKLRLTANLADNSFIHRNLPFGLTFNNPVLKINNDSLALIIDSIPINEFSINLLKDSNFKAESDYAFSDDINYTVQFLPGAFKDYFGNTNDSITYRFTRKSEREYGSVQVNFKGIDFENENLLLQLLIGEDKLYRQENVDSSILQLNFLNPNTYKLRLINDINANGIWDSGDYYTKLQPENILNYSEPVAVRGNWDLILDWKIR